MPQSNCLHRFEDIKLIERMAVFAYLPVYIVWARKRDWDSHQKQSTRIGHKWRRRMATVSSEIVCGAQILVAGNLDAMNVMQASDINSHVFTVSYLFIASTMLV